MHEIYSLTAWYILRGSNDASKDNNVSINFNPEEPLGKEMRLIVIANKNKLAKLK